MSFARWSQSPHCVRFVYQSVAGVMLPAYAEIQNDFHGKAIIKYETLEANVELPKDAFAQPPAQLE